MAQAGFFVYQPDGQMLVTPAGVRLLEAFAQAFDVGLEGFPAIPVIWPERSGMAGKVPDLAALQGALRSYRQLPVMLRARVQGGGRQTDHILQMTLLAKNGQELQEMSVRCEDSLSSLLKLVGVKSDKLSLGNSRTALAWLHDDGETNYLRCSGCGQVTSVAHAGFRRQGQPGEELQEIEKVATPGAATIQDLCACLGIPASRTVKAVFLWVEDMTWRKDRLVVALIRGDYQLSQPKLAALLGVNRMRPATEAEINASGAVPGYGSAIGTHHRVVAADESVLSSPNLVGGANLAGYHLRNTNAGRDYKVDAAGDIAQADPGFPCLCCEGTLEPAPGTQLLTVTPHLGEEALQYVNEQGIREAVHTAEVCLSLTRLAESTAFIYGDGHGLIWPVRLSPWQVHLVVLPGKNRAEEVNRAAREIWTGLESAGISVLVDDRGDSPGVKFTDADLLGSPLRITVGERGLAEGSFEFKFRKEGRKELVPAADVIGEVRRQFETEYTPSR